MPNTDNITRPITLVSFGRSGTSLAFNIMGAHPEVDACGETAPLLFGTWRAAERENNVIRPDPELGQGGDHDLRCGKAVRGAFLGMFGGDERPRWLHKPINVPYPISVRERRDPGRFEAACVWYWRALKTSFPDGRNITILRHPYDVVLSAAEFWGNPVERIWRNLVCMAKIIDHADSDIRFAISHRRFVEDPEPEVRRLLNEVGLSEHPDCFAAVDRVYVARRGEHRQPKQKMAEHVGRGFSRRDAWAKLDMSSFTDADREALAAMWARFGETLEF